ncbi:hypothetical protein [Symmachiella macrocystis]|uniref:hypothetical protein n=1 Tax=Symmachiella macrocystis TaxID=2527985 RepID=UPI0011B62257|nr:hypothetical protein [Symmachiella macrocystis]
MANDGHLEVVDINGIVFTEEGRSLCLEFVETIPPYGTFFVTFSNVLVTKLFRDGRDEFPLTVIDLKWQPIPNAEIKAVLFAHGSPFLDSFGNPRVPSTPLVIAHLEGDLVGDVIAEDVVVEPA